MTSILTHIILFTIAEGRQLSVSNE